MSNEPGCLYVVATPIGNLDDVTIRAARVLREADRILAEDTRHTRRLLDHLGVGTPMRALHDHNERACVEMLTAELQSGLRMALVSDAGTPLISDPGFPLVRACRSADVEVIAVPGPSALTAALSVAGLPTDRFRFEGFLPRRPQARRERLAALSGERATVVFYESAHRIVDSLADCVTELGPERDAVFLRELTKRYETVWLDTLRGLHHRVAADPNQQRGEIVLVIGGRTAPTADKDDDRLLRLLLESLPVRQAAAIVARFTGASKNAVYRRALDLRDQ